MDTNTTSDDRAAKIELDSCCGVLVVTNDSDDPGMAAARAAAAELAVRHDVTLTLYDRSEETWADSQHPDGPMRFGDPRLEERTHLQAQMAELQEMGARPVAWVSSLPSISAVLTALADVGADVVVVPSAMERRLFERVLVGGSMSEAMLEQFARHTDDPPQIVEVDPDGAARVVS